jgi:hypothetical protein
VEKGAEKGIVDKSSTATTATAQREAIRKREKRKRALVRFLSRIPHRFFLLLVDVLPTSTNHLSNFECCINALLHTVKLRRLLLDAQCLKKSILSMQANDVGGFCHQ